MGAGIGTFLNCGCSLIAAEHGMVLCPVQLALSKLFDALTNLENMAILLGKMQRAGMTVSSGMFEALANHCKVARDALAQATLEDGDRLLMPNPEEIPT